MVTFYDIWWYLITFDDIWRFFVTKPRRLSWVVMTYDELSWYLTNQFREAYCHVQSRPVSSCHILVNFVEDIFELKVPTGTDRPNGSSKVAVFQDEIAGDPTPLAHGNI